MRRAAPGATPRRPWLASKPAAPIRPKTAAPLPASDAPRQAPRLTREGSVLHFPQSRGHAVAVFMRGETMWIVLDGHPPLDAASLLAPLSALLVQADASQLSGAAVLKLQFTTPRTASVSQNDVALNIALSAGAASPHDAIRLDAPGRRWPDDARQRSFPAPCA